MSALIPILANNLFTQASGRWLGYGVLAGCGMFYILSFYWMKKGRHDTTALVILHGVSAATQLYILNTKLATCQPSAIIPAAVLGMIVCMFPNTLEIMSYGLESKRWAFIFRFSAWGFRILQIFIHTWSLNLNYKMEQAQNSVNAKIQSALVSVAEQSKTSEAIGMAAVNALTAEGKAKTLAAKGPKGRAAIQSATTAKVVALASRTDGGKTAMAAVEQLKQTGEYKGSTEDEGASVTIAMLGGVETPALHDRLRSWIEFLFALAIVICEWLMATKVGLNCVATTQLGGISRESIKRAREDERQADNMAEFRRFAEASIRLAHADSNLVIPGRDKVQAEAGLSSHGVAERARNWFNLKFGAYLTRAGNGRTAQYKFKSATDLETVSKEVAQLN